MKTTGMMVMAAVGMGMVLATVAMVGCGEEAPVLAVAVAAAEESPQVARGRYMVSVMGCNDCHTPLKMTPNGPEPDMDRYLSGHPEQIGPVKAEKPNEPWLWAGLPTNTAYTGPWGVSYTMNLTPDKNTGLGIWTEEMFVSAIKTGKHMGTARPINPPMPWPAYRYATEEDLKAVFAYLRTIKPIANHIPDYQPPVAPASTH